MPRTRDTQREKLYRAQRTLHFSMVEQLDIFGVRKLYEEILSSEWADRAIYDALVTQTNI